jgi:tetratricopeptide (TPR) repeat protein
MRKLQLLLTLLIAGLLIVGGTGCTAKIKSAYHLKRANRYFDSGQYDKAEIEYLNVLYHGSQNAQAIGRLGVIYFEQGRLQRAAPFILKASQLTTNDLSVRLKLGLIYLAMGKPKEARDEADFILAQKPSDQEAPSLLAEAAATQSDIDAARRQLQKISPGGDTAAIEVALGMLAFRTRDFKTAETNFTRAETLDPKFGAAFVALGTLHWAQNDLKQAEADFKNGAEFSPPRSPRKLQYAQFEVQTGNLMAGKNILDEIVKQSPDYVPGWIGLAEIALAGKNFDDCATALSQASRRDPNSFDAQFLNGRLDLARGDAAKAAAELERMAKDYPQISAVQYQLGLTYLANNQLDMAANSLRKAISLNGNFTDAILLLAQVQMKNGNLGAAIDTLQQLIARQPKIIQAQLLLADAYRVQGKVDDALAVYRKLEKSFPQNPQVPLLMGATLLQQKDNAGARKEFSRALELAPDSLPVLEQLVDLDLADNQFAAARQRVESALEKNPQTAELRLLLARVFLAQGDKAQAEAVLQKTMELQPEAQDAYLLLAQLYIDSKQSQKALTVLNTAIQKDAKNISAWMLMAEIKSDDKDYKAAADAYEKILEIDPKFGEALDNLAYLYSENLGELDRAYELAQQARNEMPLDPSTADTLGWILFRKGQYPSASSLLQEAANKMPDQSEVQFHLGMARYMMGQEEPARAAFQRALQTGVEFPGRDECKKCLAVLAIDPQKADAALRASLEKRVAEKKDDPAALARLAAIYQRDGVLDKAIETYEAALQANPKNVKAMMNLAQLYSAKNPQKAYDLAKDAYNLAPTDPDVSGILGHLAYQNANYKLAFSLLQQTAQNQPGNPKVLYDFAEAAYSVGKIPDAHAAMQNALQAGLPSSQSAEAGRFLDMITLSANPAQAIAAEPRVGEILKSEPDYVPALMTFAVINEQKNNLMAAEQAYEKALNRYPDFAPAQRKLAILYADNPGRADKAYALAIKARDTLPDDPELAKALGVIVFQQGDYARAASLLKATANAGSTNAEVFYYLGAAQYHLKNITESKTSLKQALKLNLPDKLAANAKQMLAKMK